MNNYIIYKLTFPSSKVYIGQTSNITRRFYQYKSKGVKRQPLLNNSLSKYEWDDVIKEIIHTGLSKEEADTQEIQLISTYKSLGISLNIAEGGKSGMSKKIVQFDLEGNLIKIWDSATEIAIFLGIEPTLSACNYMQAISKIKYYNIKSSISRSYAAGGFLWQYKDTYDSSKKVLKKRRKGINELKVKKDE